jgi:hypothetical protein
MKKEDFYAHYIRRRRSNDGPIQGTKAGVCPLRSWRGNVPMEDELTGDGMLILDGGITATVYYWLTVVPEPGAVIAEGSVTGSEDLMRRLKKATAAKLALVDGPTVILKCYGGRGGVRWVKALSS